MINKAISRVLIVCLCAFFSANSTFAQGVIEEIVVSAQKRDESIQDVPFTITALTGEKLDQLNVQDFADYARSIPSLDFQDLGPAGSRGIRLAAIRGIYGGQGSDTIAFYINDTPVPLVDPGVLSLDRIEVLKGPQGTLWGAGAMGGVIRLITREADADDGVAGSVKTEFSDTQYGGFNYNVSGDINIPLSDKLVFAGTAAYREDSGYIDNVTTITQAALTPGYATPDNNANDSQLVDIFAELRFAPNDNLEIAPSFLYHEGEVDALGGSNEALPELQSNFEAPTGSDEEYYVMALPVKLDLGPVTLFSITSYFEHDVQASEDSTEGNIGNFPVFFGPRFPNLRMVFPGQSFSSAQNNILDREIFTQEVRLSNNDTLTFDWTLGVYYNEDDQKRIADEDSLSTDYLDMVNVFFGGPPPLVGALGPDGNQLVFANNTTKLEEIAVFGNLTWHATDRLHLTAGLRWFDVEVETRAIRGPDFYATFFLGLTSTDDSGKFSENDVTYKASVAYDLSEEMNAYFTTSTGYRRGGPNLISQEVAAACGYSATFDSDSLENYELGIKGTFADGRVYGNAAVYYIDWSDIQQGVRNIAPGCGVGATQNFGNAEVIGGEIELTVKPADNFTFGVAASYTDAEFKTANANLGIAKGDSVPLVSDWHFSTYGQLDFPLREGIEGYLRADLQHISDALLDFVSFNFVGTPFTNDKDAYTSLGASIGARIGYGWEVKIFGRNLLDERPVIGARIGGQTNDRRVVTLRPRTFGVTVSKYF